MLPVQSNMHGQMKHTQVNPNSYAMDNLNAAIARVVRTL